MQVAPLAATAAATSTSAKSGGIAGDFDKFLRLLTTQLQHQDPLSPLDATQFTTQLVQFSQVEQSVSMNKHLTDLVTLQTAMQMQAAFGYVGQTVDVLSTDLPLADGKAELFYVADGTPAAVTVEIRDESGRVVRTLKGTAGTGVQRLAWDGKDDAGNKLADGTYKMQVVAKDAEKKTLATQSGITGRVGEVVNINGQMMLSIGGVRVPMTEVVAVRAAAQPKS